MRSALLIVATAAVAAGVATATCDPAFECKYHYQTDSDLWYWDFTSLCTSSDYVFKASGGPTGTQTFKFQICGQATQTCYSSEYDNPIPKGVAIQMWGDVPVCDKSNPGCTDHTGKKVCCDGSCHTLGRGDPQFLPISTSNPATGGIKIVHQGAPPDEAASSENCPIDENIGGPAPRYAVYNIACDKSVETIKIKSVTESPTCTYNFNLASKAGCGRIYDGPDSGQAAGGLAAGMFFLGMFLTIALGGGVYWYFVVYKKDPTFGGIFSGSSSYSSFGSGTGSSTAYGGASASAPSAYSTVGS